MFFFFTFTLTKTFKINENIQGETHVVGVNKMSYVLKVLIFV